MTKSHPHETSMLAMLDCVASLNAALQAADGIELAIGDLKEMTAMELLLFIAPNGIRFVYEEVKE